MRKTRREIKENKTKLRYDRKDVGDGEDQGRYSRENGERLMDEGIMNKNGCVIGKVRNIRKEMLIFVFMVQI